MNIVIRIATCALLLLGQYFLSHRESIIATFILPVVSVIAGIVALKVSSLGVSFMNLIPFLVLTVCLLVYGLIEHQSYKEDKHIGSDNNED